MMLIRIEAPYFVAGVEIYKTDRGYRNKTAPIIKYMKSWSPYSILKYCKKKGWKYYEFN